MIISIRSLKRAIESWIPSKPRDASRFSVSVETLEGRALLSQVGFANGANPKAQIQSFLNAHTNAGIATKKAKFYEIYTGPRLAELNAVGGAVVLQGNNFVMVGVNKGKINKNTTANFVFGIDRNGNLGTGPFPNRPSITFDAVVSVKTRPGLAPSAQVVDLTNGNTINLAASAIKIKGDAVKVIVPASMLPSTGLAPSQYHFNYWPEDGNINPQDVGSFVPETSDAPVGMIKGGATMGGGTGTTGGGMWNY